MENGSLEFEKIKLKVNNLVALRQLLTQTLALLIGGVAGIWFTANSALKFILITAGIFYIAVLAKNLYSAIYELNENLYKKLKEIE